MPPEDRLVCRFAAEPPQVAPAVGEWADTLRAEFLAACLRIDDEGEELGDAGDMALVPRPHVVGAHLRAATTRTSNGFDLFGYVSFAPGDPDGTGDEREPSDLQAWADFTDETADRHPEWKMDLCRGGRRRLARRAGHASPR